MNKDKRAQVKGARSLPRCILALKSKNFIFEGVGLQEAELGGDQSIRSAQETVPCGDGKTPSERIYATDRLLFLGPVVI
jgi:hypothetical protein